MMKKLWDFVTRRSVGNRKRDKDISQAPEFKRLVEVQRAMKDDEKIRTNQYLEERKNEGGHKFKKTKRSFIMGNKRYLDEQKQYQKSFIAGP